ncbi:GNAT family N-acetyltransferase [Altererythrobacter sp. CAU 1778]
MSAVLVRPEARGDASAVRAVHEAAFAGAPHASGTEAEIVDHLRAHGDLALSLVAESESGVVGHVAFSPIDIAQGPPDWFGLGPVGVLPKWQRQGIGSALIGRGIADLRERGAGGIVLLGDPEYYARFGFAHDPQLQYPGAPPAYFQRLVLNGSPPAGVVAYARGFR